MTKQEGYHKVTKLVRGRAATYDHSPVEISEPRFVYTDAEARDDLHSIHRRDSAADEGPKAKPRAQPDDKVSSRTTDARSKLRNAPLPLLDAAAALRYQHQTQLGIGMALGSPRQSPWSQGSLPAPKSGSAAFQPAPHAFSSVPYSPIVTPEPRDDLNRQKGKWKVLGGLFAKKPSSAQLNGTEPFPKLQHEHHLPQVQTAQPSRQNFPSESQHRRVGSRSLDLNGPFNGISPNAKLEVRQVQNAPYSATYQAERSPRPPPKDKPKPAKLPLAPIDTLPILQVNIPDTKMERYSVMFDNVLNPRHSTLLMRRQAQLERLKIREAAEITEEPMTVVDSLEPPYRRATLPSPAKSPSYSLFPQTSRDPSPKPSRNAAIGPLKRSATAPTLSPVPPSQPIAEVHKAITTPQIIIEEDISPLPESPETPKEPGWPAAEVSPLHPRSASLGENDANPRQLSTTSIVIHLAEDPTHTVWKQIPEPRQGTIELAGTPIYHAPVLSPIPTRPAQISALTALNKPLPSLTPETEEFFPGSGQAPHHENSSQLQESLSPLSQAPALRSPRPPRKDSHHPPIKPVRSQSYDSWTPQDLSQRMTQPKKARDSKLRRPSHPTRDSSVPTQSNDSPKSPPTLFHLQSPRKASLPVGPSQPLESWGIRKGSAALQQKESLPEQVRSPPKSFPMPQPQALVAMQPDVAPATPPKSSPPVPTKHSSKTVSTKEGTAQYHEVRSFWPSVALPSNAAEGKLRTSSKHERMASIKDQEATVDWSKPASAIAQWPDPESTAATIVSTGPQHQTSATTAERRPSMSRIGRPPSLQRKPVGSTEERRPSTQSADSATTERRPSGSATETQQHSVAVVKRRPSTAAISVPPRPSMPRSATDRPHPLKSAPATAAEISIARQISISRRQQMMVPIVPKTARQPQQATLVVEGAPAGGRSRHVPRKSQHALLETA